MALHYHLLQQETGHEPALAAARRLTRFCHSGLAAGSFPARPRADSVRSLPAWHGCRSSRLRGRFSPPRSHSPRLHTQNLDDARSSRYFSTRSLWLIFSLPPQNQHEGPVPRLRSLPSDARGSRSRVPAPRPLPSPKVSSSCAQSTPSASAQKITNWVSRNTHFKKPLHIAQQDFKKQKTKTPQNGLF